MDMEIDDTLRATYETLKGSFNGDFAAEPVEDANPEEVDLELDTPVPAEGEEGEPVDPAAQAEGGEPAAEPETPPEGKFQPKWKKAALSEWEKLPAAVQAEVERRENDFHKGIEQYKERAATSQEWERTVQPFLATIQSYGVTPQTAAHELFKADHLLRYSAMPDKVQMLLKVARDYGVDINTLAHGIQQIAGEQVWQQQNPVDPVVQQLQNQVAQLTQQNQQVQQQHAAREYSAIDEEIAAFAAEPDHEHFQILQKPMAVLLQSGQAKNLPEAYEMAMRQNPQTYQVWLAQQQQEWDAQRKANVVKAKKAGANVVRPNGRASVATSGPKRTMEQDIEATARELGLLT